MKKEEDFDYLEDEEEIDIVKLVSTNANDSNQYLLFIGQDDQYYAKNVAKIEEIVVYKNLNIVHNYDKSIILGVADIRGEMLSLINFDTWLCGKNCDGNNSEFVIVMNYGGEKFGLVVKGVESIITIETKDMISTNSGNLKSSFTTKIELNKQDILCTVIDSDKMLLEGFTHNDDKVNDDLSNLKTIVNSDKLVLFADDSKLIQNMMRKISDKLQLNYKIFDNGEELWQDLCQSDIENIGLVVTDIEMPILGGKELLRRIRNKHEFNKLNIIVHSNMINQVVQKELTELGANDIVGKINVENLTHTLKSYLR